MAEANPIMDTQLKPTPLLLRDIVFRGADQRPDAHVVTWQSGQRHIQSLSDTVQRAEGLARGLGSLGVTQGSRVATLMWNDHRHLESYLAVPCMGAAQVQCDGDVINECTWTQSHMARCMHVCACMHASIAAHAHRS